MIIVKYFQKGFAPPAILLIGAILIAVAVFVYRLSNQSVTLESLTTGLFQSSKSVDTELESIVTNIAKTEETKGNYDWDKIQVSQRKQDGARILELTITLNSGNGNKPELKPLFKLLKNDYNSNSEVRKSFDGFELRIIGVVRIESLWEKFGEDSQFD